METFEKIVGWLFKHRTPGYVPQVGMASGDKKALIWIPGKLARTEIAVTANAITFLGCSNRAYPSAYEAMHSQESEIVCAMIDIDGHDNLGFTVEEMVEVVKGLMGDKASIRTSSGGKGLHVIFRLAHPVSVPAFPARSVHTSVTKQILRPYVETLERSGIHCCKHDSRLMWLWGGKNRWVHRTEALLSIPVMSLEAEIKRNKTPGVHLGGKLHPEIRSWLERLEVRPGLIYVGDVVKRLRELGEVVTTKSGCSGDGKANGYIDVDEFSVSLWTYADGCAVWKYVVDCLEESV